MNEKNNDHVVWHVLQHDCSLQSACVRKIIVIILRTHVCVIILRVRHNFFSAQAAWSAQSMRSVCWQGWIWPEPRHNFLFSCLAVEYDMCCTSSCIEKTKRAWCVVLLFFWIILFIFIFLVSAAVKEVMIVVTLSRQSFSWMTELCFK